MRLHHVLALLVVALAASCSNDAPPDAPETEATPAESSTDKSTPATPADASKPKEPQVTSIPAPSDVAAAPADATTTESGLAYKVLQAGTGAEHAGPTSTVTVHYTGWTTDGKMFDSSVTRGKTISFPLTRVIPGWTEGVQLMVAGEKTRFWIPGALAYGDTPQRPGAPAGMLVFDIELFEIR